MVDVNILVLRKDKANGQIFNVGGGQAISVYDFAVKISKIYDRKELKPQLPGLYRFGDTRNACSDISKIKYFLGWSPKNSIETSIIEYKDYLKSQGNIDDILDYTKKNMKKLNVLRKPII